MRRPPHNVLRPAQSGVTLVELMVALGIGSFLMVGAVTVYMQSKTAFNVSESVSRLQENARYAFEILEPDIRMAHYWGLTARTNRIPGPCHAPGAGTAGPGCRRRLPAELGYQIWTRRSAATTTVTRGPAARHSLARPRRPTQTLWSFGA